MSKYIQTKKQFTNFIAKAIELSGEEDCFLPETYTKKCMDLTVMSRISWIVKNDSTALHKNKFNKIAERENEKRRLQKKLQNTYEYKLKKEIKPLKDKKGLYHLYDKGVLVYIGKSSNIYTRILNHYGDKIFNYVEFYEMSMSDASVIEQYEIAKYRPKYNAEGVYDDELTITANIDFSVYKGYKIHLLENVKMFQIANEDIIPKEHQDIEIFF